MHWITGIWLRLRGLVWRKQLDRDLGAEIKFHLEMRQRELEESGMSSEQARYAASRRFGNQTLIQERGRQMFGFGSLEELFHDIRYATRTLLRSPGFTATTLAALALGIGANTAIFTFVSDAFLKPLPYPDADRIVVLRQRTLRPIPGVAAETLVHPRSFVRWQDRALSFESMALTQPVPMITEGADGAEQVPGLWVSPDLFRVLGVRLFLGQGFSSEAGLGRAEVRNGRVSEVILSHGYWQRRFGGDPSILGKTIPAGRASAVVVGVVPSGFQVGAFSVDVYTPIRIDKSRPESIGSRSFVCFARLRPGATLESARAEMELIAAQVGKEDEIEKQFGPVVISLRDHLIGESRSTLFILSGVVGLILLIVCGNLASLLLTRGIGRQGELAVRTALGAGRWRIVRQLGVESLILSGLGGLLGLGLGWAGSRVLAALPESAPYVGQLSDGGLDWRVLAFTMVLVCGSTFLFGLLPAWQVSQVDLQSSVKAQGRGAIGGQVRTRSLLVIAEVALAFVLLVGASLLLRSFSNLAEVKLGFRPANVLTMRTLIMGSTEFRGNLAQAILEKVESLPGVQAVGTIEFLPLAGLANQGPFHFVGRPLPADPNSMESDVSKVSRGYFTAVGMELLHGRFLGPAEDRIDSPRVALVNQAFVNRYSREENPIGRVIIGDWSNPKPTEIVGVVNDVRHNGLDTEPRPTVFLAQSQVPGYYTNLVVRTAIDPAAMAATIRREVRQVAPRQPFTDIQPLAHYVSTQLARPRLYATFVGIFAALALFLAAIGLYGLLAYEIRQRTHEIGLRMALGAQPRDVVVSTMWQGGRLVVAGLALGAFAAFAVNSVVSKFLFGVGANDLVSYVGVSAVFGLVAVIATFVPAHRAAAIDPLIALRYE